MQKSSDVKIQFSFICNNQDEKVLRIEIIEEIITENREEKSSRQVNRNKSNR